MSMSSFGFGSADPFGEMLNRFFGTSPASSPPAVQRVPIGRLLSDSSQEVLNLAARKAVEDGTSDLDTEHLLWAVTKVDPARRILAQAGVDPDALAAEIA
ncbi:ATP-dependent Clp protease ATP-binding subunit, partial [Streptomyces sp. SID7803]|nr:ATP-dependent Clp protease ATP-binding subunit [Streptomyces sp. SID7803]